MLKGKDIIFFLFSSGLLSGLSLPGPSFNKPKNFWPCKSSFSKPDLRFLMKVSLQALSSWSSQLQRIWVEVFECPAFGREWRGRKQNKELFALPIHFIQRFFAAHNGFWVSVTLHNPATHHQAAQHKFGYNFIPLPKCSCSRPLSWQKAAAILAVEPISGEHFVPLHRIHSGQTLPPYSRHSQRAQSSSEQPQPCSWPIPTHPQLQHLLLEPWMSTTVLLEPALKELIPRGSTRLAQHLSRAGTGATSGGWSPVQAWLCLQLCLSSLSTNCTWQKSLSEAAGQN